MEHWLKLGERLKLIPSVYLKILVKFAIGKNSRNFIPRKTFQQVKSIYYRVKYYLKGTT